jgi:hypothetical protein
VRWTMLRLHKWNPTLAAGPSASCSLPYLDGKQQESARVIVKVPNRPHVKASQVSCDVGRCGWQEKASEMPGALLVW